VINLGDYTVFDYLEYVLTGGVYNHHIKNEYIDELLKLLYFKIQEIKSLNGT